MTEFETASLALREAALYTAMGHATIALLIGAGQIGIVYYGIRTMQKMGLQRATETQTRDNADIRRHTETMTALQELIRRTSGPQAA